MESNGSEIGRSCVYSKAVINEAQSSSYDMVRPKTTDRQRDGR